MSLPTPSDVDVVVLAIDLSLRATGVADDMNCWTVKPPAAMRGHERNELVLAELARGPRTMRRALDLVVFEGYSFGSRNHHLASIAELKGLVAHSLWQGGIEQIDVAPTQLKKWCTGQGNATKEQVVEYVRAVAPSRTFDDDNQADAFVLHEMAQMAYGRPSYFATQQYRLALLDAIDWPAL